MGLEKLKEWRCVPLKKVVDNQIENIKRGDAWVVFWKYQSSWNTSTFWVDEDTQRIRPREMKRADEILKQDGNAIVVNGSETEKLRYMGPVEMTDEIMWQYQERQSRLCDKYIYTDLPTEEEERFRRLLPEEFRKTPIGEELAKIVNTWDIALENRWRAMRGINGYPGAERLPDVKDWEQMCAECRARWEVMQTVLRELYGVEFHFTRSETWSGVCDETETVWLVQHFRKPEDLR